jgi:predicted Ser/Thr protein kinase
MPNALALGRFELLERIGAGGMGEVWRARDRESGALVAVKRLRGHDSAYAERLVREAELLARIDAPGVVAFVESGVDESGALHLVMEWLDGEDLEKRLARGPLAVPDTLRLARAVCEALAVTHARGVVHRDLKPSNIVLSGGDPGAPRLIDFGIARSTKGTRVLTQTGALLGTVGYMAPEQARGEAAIDGRADFFSLGCVLFECVAGRPAFEGEHAVAILAQILLDRAPRLSALVADVPAELDDLVFAMMSPDKKDRPPDAASVLARLEGSGGTVAAPSALSSAEQRYACVLLVTRRAEASADESTIARGSLGVLVSPSVRERIEETGGRITELTADASLVLFEDRSGASVLSEIAVRAARCARALRDADASIVVTMATGLARDDVRAPVGSAVDRAAGLLSRAPTADGVPLDAMSARLLEGRFEIGAAADHAVLGVERSRGRRFLGRATPCVGRRRELAFLSAAFEECAEERVAQAVLLVAEAGVGKSRLVHELALRAAGAACLVARGDPVYADATFSLVSQLALRALELEEGPSRTQLREALAPHIATDQLERVTLFMGELLGVAADEGESAALGAARRDAALMGQQLRRALTTLFTSFVPERPLVVVIEDVHWGDHASVALLPELVRGRQAGALLVATARPGVDARFSRLWEQLALRRLEVAPLDSRAAETLARELLGADADPAILDRIVATAGGNAFFVEELVRHVREGAAGALPETVVAMAEARLRTLSAEGRRVLRAASIFGERFERDGVRALVGSAGGLDLDRELDALVRAEVVEPRSERELAFRHGLLREAAYGALTPDDRALGHRLAAEWLARERERDARVIAEHFALAGEPQRAAPWWLEAARAAFHGGQLTETARLSSLGIACEPDRALEGRLWMMAAEAHGWADELEAAALAAERAIAVIDRGTAGWVTAVSCFAYAVVYGMRRDDIERALALARDVPLELELSPSLGRDIVRIALPLQIHGERELAIEMIARLDRAVLSASDTVAPSVFGYAAASHAYFGVFGLDDRAQALEQARRAKAWLTRSDDVLGLLLADYCEMIAMFDRGELDECAAMAERLEQAAIDRGVFGVLSATRQFHALALVSRSRLDEAEALMRRSLERAVGFYELQAHTTLAIIALRRKDSGAIEQLLRCHASAGSVANLRLPISLALAGAMAALGRREEALRYLEEVERDERRTGGVAAVERSTKRLRAMLTTPAE